MVVDILGGEGAFRVYEKCGVGSATAALDRGKPAGLIFFLWVRIGYFSSLTTCGEG